MYKYMRTLYASKEIEVRDRKTATEEQSATDNSPIERVRSSTYDRDIFRLSEGKSNQKDSDTEDDGEQLDLV